MSANPTPPDFDEAFQQALDQWQAKHKIKEDDAILLLLELFRIHQAHWDELRKRQIPSLDGLKKDLTAMIELGHILKERSDREKQTVGRTAALIAVIAALMGGFFLGHSL